MSKLLNIMTPKTAPSRLLQAMKTPKVSKLTPLSSVVKFPTPKRYLLTYQKPNSIQNDTYEISHPIEDDGLIFKVYSYNRSAIRSFRRDRVIALKEISVKNIIK